MMRAETIVCGEKARMLRRGSTLHWLHPEIPTTIIEDAVMVVENKKSKESDIETDSTFGGNHEYDNGLIVQRSKTSRSQSLPTHGKVSFRLLRER